FVSGNQRVPRRSVFRGLRLAELGRRDESAFRKILIARRLRLAVPQHFIFDLTRRKFAYALEAKRRMAEIGNRLMAVLEIEAFEKLLRVMRLHPFDRLANRIRGAA